MLNVSRKQSVCRWEWLNETIGSAEVTIVLTVNARQLTEKKASRRWDVTLAMCWRIEGKNDNLIVYKFSNSSIFWLNNARHVCRLQPIITILLGLFLY